MSTRLLALFGAVVPGALGPGAPATTLLPPTGEDDAPALVEVPTDFRSRGAASPHVAYGPLETPRTSAIQDLRLGLLPRPVAPVGAGRFELRWSETWANVWGNRAGDFRIDYETLVTELSVSYGLDDATEVELVLHDRNRFGGELDSLIEDWHDALGITQNGRDRFEKDQNQILFAPAGSDPGATVEESGSVSTDLILRIQRMLTPGDEVWPAVALAGTAKWNVGGENSLDGSDLDLGLTLSGARHLGRSFYGYLMVGHQWFGSDEFAGIELEDRQLSALAALEWNFASRTSAVVQYSWNQAVAEHRAPLDDSAQELVFGVEHEAFGCLFELGLIENVANIDNSPDFGMYFGLRRRF